MDIYHLGWIEEPEEWFDKAFGFVGVAESEAQARQIVSAEHQYPDVSLPVHAGAEGVNPWRDASLTFCVRVETDRPRVVLRHLRSS